MRISITYLYTILKYGYPHPVDDAIKALPEMRKLGFRFIEMEGLGQQNLHEFYSRKGKSRKALDGEGVHVHNYCVVDPDMVSLNPDLRRAALDRFRMGAEIAELLGAETLHLASYAPPVEYLQSRPYGLNVSGGYKFENINPASAFHRASTGANFGTRWSNRHAFVPMSLRNTAGSF